MHVLPCSLQCSAASSSGGIAGGKDSLVPVPCKPLKVLPPIMLIKDCFHKAQTKEEMSTKPEKSCTKIYCLIGSSCSTSKIISLSRGLWMDCWRYSYDSWLFLLVKLRSYPEFLSLYECMVPLPLSFLFLCGSFAKTRKPVGCLMLGLIFFKGIFRCFLCLMKSRFNGLLGFFNVSADAVNLLSH